MRTPITKYEDITPSKARALLGANIDNRKLQRARVAQYADVMRIGQWRLTHQGIAIGDDGRLYDGQHRLAAIVEAGVTIRMLVTRNLEPPARDEIDTGCKRSVSDNLAIVDNIRVTRLSSGAYRALWARTEIKALRAFTTDDLRMMRGKYQSALSDLEPVFNGGGRVRGILTCGVIAAFLFAHAADPAGVHKALVDLKTGTDLDANDAILVLRNRQLSMRGRSSGRVEEEDFNRALSAIKARISGQARRLAKAQGEVAFAFFAKANSR